MRLRDCAHVRTGDKGDTMQVSVIAFEPAGYPLIERSVTEESVRRHFRALPIHTVRRYELPGLGALNFVLEGALKGGVTRSLSLDAHGKTLGAQLLDLEIGG